MSSQPPYAQFTEPAPKPNRRRCEALVAFACAGMVAGLALAEFGWPVLGWTVSIASWAVVIAVTWRVNR